MPALGTGALTPAKIGIAQREASALRLRLAGVSFEDIAKSLGYKNRSGAQHAVKRALAKTLREPADELRELERLRYDAFQVPIWQPATSGDRDAIRLSLLISKGRRELDGLDKPGKLALTNPEGTAEYGGDVSEEQRIARIVAVVRALEAEGAAGFPGAEDTERDAEVAGD